MATTASRPTDARPDRPDAATTPTSSSDDPAYQAFWLLRPASPSLRSCSASTSSSTSSSTGTATWLPTSSRTLPWTAHQLMYAVGVIEIVAGLVVALRPRFGGYLVAAWLAGIIVNLLVHPGRSTTSPCATSGSSSPPLALARLATAFDAPARPSCGPDADHDRPAAGHVRLRPVIDGDR